MFLIQKKYVCPICSHEMVVEYLHDDVAILKCTHCYSTIHFGSWEIQRIVVDGEDLIFKGEKL